MGTEIGKIGKIGLNYSSIYLQFSHCYSKKYEDNVKIHDDAKVVLNCDAGFEVIEATG